MSYTEISPFLKWAGGKGQLLDRIIERMPREYNNYYEPFIGGGAVLFGVRPNSATINDVNEQLINIYKQLQTNAQGVIDVLDELDSVVCDKEYYFGLRDKYNRKIQNNVLDAECAALMIWLNKHCFNGLYRVNSKGLFNVPWNNKSSGSSYVEENLLGIGEYLKNIKIANVDFEVVCESASAGDFVYFDSPYVPESTTADFTSYTKDGFSYADHVRLANLFTALSEQGVKVMLSNNDVELVRELYKGFNIESIEVKRLINRDASKRKGREVIITNY